MVSAPDWISRHFMKKCPCGTEQWKFSTLAQCSSCEKICCPACSKEPNTVYVCTPSTLVFCNDCQSTELEYETVVSRFPTNPRIWANVGRELSPGQLLTVPLHLLRVGVTSDEKWERQCREVASAHSPALEACGSHPAMDSHVTDSFDVINDSLSHNSFRRKDDGVECVRLGAKQCFERALELQPTDQVWRDLAVCMEWTEKAVLRLATKKDNHNDQQQAACVEDGPIDEDKLTYSTVVLDCEAVYNTALHISPKEGNLWYSLAQHMPPSSVVKIADRPYTQLQCLAQACEVDPRNIYSWVMRGVVIKELGIAAPARRGRAENNTFTRSRQNTTLTVSSGSPPTSTAHYRHSTGSSRSVGAIVSSRQIDDSLLQTQKVSWMKCFETALKIANENRHRGQLSAVWSNLASVMEDSDPKIFGRDRIGAAVEAFRCDSCNPTSIFNLAVLLQQYAASPDSFCSSPDDVDWDAMFPDGHEVLEYIRGSLDSASSRTMGKKGVDEAGETTTCTEPPKTLMQYILDKKMPLRSVKLRLFLTIMYPDHPHILSLNNEFVANRNEMIHRGYEGEIFAAKEIRDGIARRELVAKRMPFDMNNLNAMNRRLFDELREITVLLNEKFSSVIVPCVHVAFEKPPGNDDDDGREALAGQLNMQGSVLIFMERAIGSLKDYIEGRIQFKTNHKSHHHQDLAKNKSAQALAFTFEIARQLSVLHSFGFVHADVKPDNVLLFADGSVRLADFGFSRSIKGKCTALSSLAIGTDGYRPPEVLGEVADLPTTGMDVFALGCTLYHMSCGYTPDIITSDPDDTEWELMWPEGLEPEDETVREVVRRCTMVNPSERPSCVELMDMDAMQSHAQSLRSGASAKPVVAASF